MTEQAYDLLRHQILHGEFEPGTIVSERLLAQRLSLGKAPIRAAVQRLASEGFMTIEPRRGIVISRQSIQDVIDLYEIRVALEQLVARQIAGKLSDAQIEQLRENLGQHESLAESADPVASLAVDFEFHRMLCEFHGNAHLTLVLSRIRNSLFPELRLSHLKSPERLCKALDEHRALVDAIVSGDAAEAERLVGIHLSGCQQFVMSRGLPRNGWSPHGKS
jgi:DNA-binding GntR family transcriptional regulator